jgi:predicted NBD/HSP70 family sugar kinase
VRTGHRDLIRDLNRSLVLNLVRERTSLSRAELARISGLSASTVTAITSSLLHDGFLIEEGHAQGTTTAIGRPATQLRVDPSAGHVVGIKVAADDLTATVTDLAATPLGFVTIARGHESGPDDVANLFDAAVSASLEAASVPASSLFGVGIGVPGIVDPASGRVTNSPLLEWAHLDLVRLLEPRLGHPVLIDNDVNTLTVAEQLFGAGRGLAHFMVVTVGRGIGMGLVVNGAVYRGARGGAGEFGHVQAVADGPDCWCGRRGCLEAVAAEPALVREVLALTGRLVPAADLGSVAHRDARVTQVLANAGAVVGRAIAAATSVLDPERVVVSGEGVRLGTAYLEPLRAGFAERSGKGSTTALVIEPWGDDAWARGAATLVLRELFHPAHLRDEGAGSSATSQRGATDQLARTGRGGRR